MAKVGNPFNLSSMVVIVLVAVAGIYLYNQFQGPIACSAEDVTNQVTGCTSTSSTHTGFVVPTDTNTIGMWMLKFLIIGAALFIGLKIATNVAVSGLNRRALVTLIILGIVIVVIWKYIAGPIFHASSLDTITFKTAMKLGMAN